MRCQKDRTDYAMNGEKTDEGKYISSYQCNTELVDLEFAQARCDCISDPLVLQAGRNHTGGSK